MLTDLKFLNIDTYFRLIKYNTKGFTALSSPNLCIPVRKTASFFIHGIFCPISESASELMSPLYNSCEIGCRFAILPSFVHLGPFRKSKGEPGTKDESSFYRQVLINRFYHLLVRDIDLFPNTVTAFEIKVIDISSFEARKDIVSLYSYP